MSRDDREPQRKPQQLFSSYEELEQAFAAHLNRGKAEFYRAIGIPFAMGRRSGISFEDAYTGKRYINCHSNGGVFNLGHRHPRVVAAVREALGVLDIGNHHLVSGFRTRLAERLSATTEHRLSKVVFGVSGGEAADLAIKTARATTGRQGIISARGGYHGHTGLAMAAGDPAYREPFGPSLPGFMQVPFNSIEDMDSAIGDDTAAVIIEAIPATLGMPIPREGYFAELRRLCSQRGALLIIDEVQTGLGRTGRFWGYQHEGITPDAILTGKGLSGGVYPITATIMTEKMHAVLDGNPFVHFSTFGGSELGCVAALEVIDIVEEKAFLERVRGLADLFARGFTGLPFQLRQRGLFMGLCFASEAQALRSFQKLLDAGVFAFPAGNDRSVLQFLPPLLLSDEEAEDLLGRVRGVFA